MSGVSSGSRRSQRCGNRHTRATTPRADGNFGRSPGDPKPSTSWGAARHPMEHGAGHSNFRLAQDEAEAEPVPGRAKRVPDCRCRSVASPEDREARSAQRPVIA